VTHAGRSNNSKRTLVGKSLRKHSHGSLRRWDEDVKVKFRESGYKNAKWAELIQSSV
jgi:hypothetical protein